MQTRSLESTIENVPVALASASAVAAVEWATSQFGAGLCVLASMQDAVLIDVVLAVDRSIDVVFLDTGFHFEETLDTLRRVEDRYRKRITVLRPAYVPRGSVSAGECCASKVDLLNEALAGRSAWMSGVRRSDSSTRSATPIVETDRRGLVKVNPLAQWSDEDVDAYVRTNDVIRNPLLDQGYDSIGCAPCTTKPDPTGGRRSGRWPGTDRTECGIHG